LSAGAIEQRICVLMLGMTAAPTVPNDMHRISEEE